MNESKKRYYKLKAQELKKKCIFLHLVPPVCLNGVGLGVVLEPAGLAVRLLGFGSLPTRVGVGVKVTVIRVRAMLSLPACHDKE